MANGPGYGCCELISGQQSWPLVGIFRGHQRELFVAARGQNEMTLDERLRKGYNSLNPVFGKGNPFTFLPPRNGRPGHQQTRTTTNMIEGGINSGIRNLLLHHRGMPIEHRRRAVAWFCWDKAGPESRPKLAALLRPEHYTRQNPNSVVKALDEEPVGPELYGTAAIADEGLFSRSGWGGRSG